MNTSASAYSDGGGHGCPEQVRAWQPRGGAGWKSKPHPRRTGHPWDKPGNDIGG